LKTAVTVQPESLAPFFSLLVERIEGGSQDAIHELQLHFLRGVRYLLTRRLGQDRSDHLASSVLADVVEAIQNGEVSEPERLPAFVQMAVHRTLELALDYLPPGSLSETPRREDLAEADRVLRSLPARDKEILIRFYCQEQPPEAICREMGVSAAQFRAIKSRARERFAKSPSKGKNI